MIGPRNLHRKSSDRYQGGTSLTTLLSRAARVATLTLNTLRRSRLRQYLRSPTGHPGTLNAPLPRHPTPLGPDEVGVGVSLQCALNDNVSTIKCVQRPRSSAAPGGVLYADSTMHTPFNGGVWHLLPSANTGVAFSVDADTRTSSLELEQRCLRSLDGGEG